MDRDYTAVSTDRVMTELKGSNSILLPPFYCCVYVHPPLRLDAVSSIGYSLWLRLPVSGLLLGWLWTVLVDCLGVAILVATVLW